MTLSDRIRANTGNRTGLARKLRDYIRDHPGSTSGDVFAALGGDAGRIGRTLVKMRRQGHFIGTVLERTNSRESLYAYTLAREPERPQYATPEESARVRKERRRAYDRKYAECERLANQATKTKRQEIAAECLSVKPEPVRVEAETVEQFLARMKGKNYEVLPGFQSVRYFRNPVRQAQRGARAIA